MEVNVCPYCGSARLECHENGNPFYCLGCGLEFSEEDAEYESVRHELADLVKDTDGQHPLHCEITIGEDEAQGLSTLELPVVLGIYKGKYGNIWFNIYGVEEPLIFDELSLRNVSEILKELKLLTK